jgi:hypothetical protein
MLATKEAPAEYLIDPFAKSFLGYTPYRCVRLRLNRAQCANLAVHIRAPASPPRPALCCVQLTRVFARNGSDQLDKWGRDYMGGDEAMPGKGGGFTFVCSVSESGEIQGCPSG